MGVVLAGGLKYLVNIIQTKIGQQATMEMRRQLFKHILRLPLSFFKKNQPGMVVTSLYYQDASVSYYRTMEHFDALPEHRFDPEKRSPLRLENRIEVDGLSLVVDDGLKLLDKISLQIEPGKAYALVGPSGSGKSSMVHCIDHLLRYSGGSVRLGGEEVAELTKRDVAHNIGFVSQNPYIFSGTFQQNLLYACRAEIDSKDDADTSGMPTLDDMIEIIQQTGIFADVLRFGLNATLDPDRYHELVPSILKIRKRFQRLSSEEISDRVEFFIKERYLFYSSVAHFLF